MAHTNQIREFLLTEHGIDLLEVYSGPAGVLTGFARLTQEAKEQAEKHLRAREIECLQQELDRKRKTLEAQIAAMCGKFEAEENDVKKMVREGQDLEAQIDEDRVNMMKSRKVD